MPLLLLSIAPPRTPQSRLLVLLALLAGNAGSVGDDFKSQPSDSQTGRFGEACWFDSYIEDGGFGRNCLVCWS